MFTLGTLALLATPGPTNTLLATSGATLGVRPSLTLLFGEAAGYLCAILILRTVLGPILADQALLTQALSALVCVYLFYLSWALWQSSSLPLKKDVKISIGSVFVTTLLNPKAVVFAYVLLPPGGLADLAPWLGALLVLITFCGTSWLVIGAAVMHQSGQRAELGYRAGAIALFLLAMALGTRASGMA
jgi:threonine/homoserine/homoserine lactone efflux protein